MGEPADLLDVFRGVRPVTPRNDDDFAYAVAMEDGWADAMTGRAFTVPREGGRPAKEGYSEGFARAQEAKANGASR